MVEHKCEGLCADFHCAICGEPATLERPASTGPSMHNDCEDREIYALGSRVSELESALRDALMLIDNANSGAWSNGNTAPNGIDEGDVLTSNYVKRLRSVLGSGKAKSELDKDTVELFSKIYMRLE